MIKPVVDRTAMRKMHSAVLPVAIVLAGSCLMTFSEAVARTYEVISIRQKVVQGDWNVSPKEWSHIPRQESYGTQWALEMVGLTEGRVKTRLFDSTDSVIWEGETGDILLLSLSSPAFAVRSNFGGQWRIYNLDVGKVPVFDVTYNSTGRLFQSRDGTAFGFSKGTAVDIVSIEGHHICAIPADKSKHLGSTALANAGEYVAIGVWRWNREASRDVREHHVSLFDRDGELISRIDQESDRYLPRCLALSPERPPRIAIATARGASLWSPSGDLIWSDTTAFVLSQGRLLVKALRVTDDGCVLSVTTTSDALATFWAWDTVGTLAARLDLPGEFNALSYGADFMGATESSVAIQSHSEVLTVRWDDE